MSVVRAKLTAFALSGSWPPWPGVLLVTQQGGFTLGLFPEEDNLVVFTAAVVGGLGSVAGSVIGALFLMGGDWFLQDAWRLFASSVGVLLVLLLVPGGLGGALFRARDLGLRWVARRRGIVVPSLVADVRVLEAEAEEAFEERASASPSPAPDEASGSTDARSPGSGRPDGGADEGSPAAHRSVPASARRRLRVIALTPPPADERPWPERASLRPCATPAAGSRRSPATGRCWPCSSSPGSTGSTSWPARRSRWWRPPWPTTSTSAWPA